jgi:hypothetical protein
MNTLHPRWMCSNANACSSLNVSASTSLSEFDS